MEPSHCEELPEKNPETNPPSKLTRKREDYICWADYFMAVASLTALRSKDPNSQVGACIVNEENKIVGVGYNGMPNRCSDDLLPWAREADNVLDTKYPYVCHAEMNAICNKNCADLKGCTIYVALFPCNECAKLIIQSCIKEVVYMSDKYHNTPNIIASKKLLDMAGVIHRDQDFWNVSSQDGVGVAHSCRAEGGEQSEGHCLPMRKMEKLLEQRYVIKFCVRLKKSATETFEMLQEMFGEDLMSQANVFQWHKQLKNGREDMLDSSHQVLC